MGTSCLTSIRYKHPIPSVISHDWQGSTHQVTLKGALISLVFVPYYKLNSNIRTGKILMKPSLALKNSQILNLQLHDVKIDICKIVIKKLNKIIRRRTCFWTSKTRCWFLTIKIVNGTLAKMKCIKTEIANLNTIWMCVINIYRF